MLDIAVAFSRYRFLGPEFLTWLWYAIETDPDGIKAAAMGRGLLTVGDRIVLESSADQRAERVTITGENADLGEGIVALKKGALVAELRLHYKAGDDEWRFSLKGDTLALTGLKTPRAVPVESPDEVEGAVVEKVGLCEEVVRLLDSLFLRFIKLRVSERWREKAVPGMKAWIKAARP
ncbi:MAG TPA: hypothetical protein VES58_10340 [Syntrophobacteria bacterium]|nr:hypothetical protein [Syntrophobacteria bacterium]